MKRTCSYFSPEITERLGGGDARYRRLERRIKSLRRRHWSAVATSAERAFLVGSPRAYARAAAALAAEEAERRANIEAAAKEVPDLGMCQPCGPRQPSLPPNGGVRFLAGPAVQRAVG